MQRKKMDNDRIVDGVLIGSYLTIIILRIFNVITWAWKWILAPIWIPFGIGLFIAVCFLFMLLIMHFAYDKGENNKDEWY